MEPIVSTLAKDHYPAAGLLNRVCSCFFIFASRPRRSPEAVLYTHISKGCAIALLHSLTAPPTHPSVGGFFSQGSDEKGVGGGEKDGRALFPFPPPFYMGLGVGLGMYG